jgi:hypothetical protein
MGLLLRDNGVLFNLVEVIFFDIMAQASRGPEVSREYLCMPNRRTNSG